MRVNRSRPVVYLPDVEVTHYGRVSSRANIAFTDPNLAAGYVRSLRKAGTAPAALWVYKLLVTIDAPLYCLAKSCQCAWATGLPRPAQSRPQPARRSGDVVLPDARPGQILEGVSSSRIPHCLSLRHTESGGCVSDRQA